MLHQLGELQQNDAETRLELLLHYLHLLMLSVCPVLPQCNKHHDLFRALTG